MAVSRALPVIACLAVGALGIAVGMNPLSNNDIWLHLTTGRLILERGSVPHQDEYSFTNAGSPYTAHEWLAQILLTLVFRAAGTSGLIAIKPVCLVTAAALCALTSRALGAGRAAALAAAVLAIASMASHLFVRPHLFTLVALALASWLLVKLRSGKRWALWALILTQLIWVNLHGGFLLGIVLSGAMGCWLAAAAMSLTSLINPYGASILPFVLVFAEPAFRRIIREWGGTFEAPFAGTFHFYVYLMMLSLSLVAAAHHARRRRYGPALALLTFSALSVLAKRHASVLGVVAAPWIALALSEARRTLWRAWRPGRGDDGPLAATAAATLLLAAGAAWLGVPHETGRARVPGLGLGPNVPVAALDFAASHGLEGNVFASFGFASYVTYRAFPASRVFIDSRLDVYGGPFLERYQKAATNPGDMRELLASYRVDYAVLSYRLEEAEGPVLAFAQDPGWALVYQDDLAMIYVRRQARYEPLVAAQEYRIANPYLFLSGRLDLHDSPETAILETGRVLALNPGAVVARLMRAAALQSAARHAEAIAVLHETSNLLEPADEGQALLLGLLGTSYAEMGDDAMAEDAFEKLLRAAPGSQYARQMLERLRAKTGS